MIVKTREMGMTHRDFFRTFPAVARETPWRVDDDAVIVGEERGRRRLLIRLGAERQRRIAGLTLPIVDLRFEFEGHDEPEAGAFMARFDLAFRRGGG
jgi:hypothetical protein